MPYDPTFEKLLWRSLAAVTVGAALVALCYIFLDRPVAFFVHDHGFGRDVVLKWMTYPPPIVQRWVPVVLVALMVRRAWGPLNGWQQTLLAASVGLVLADQALSGWPALKRVIADKVGGQGQGRG